MQRLQISTFHQNIVSGGTVVSIEGDLARLFPQQPPVEMQPKNYTQVGGVYGLEIRPQFLTTVDNVHLAVEGFVAGDSEPRFFRIK
jgi:hypothetical protein